MYKRRKELDRAKQEIALYKKTNPHRPHTYEDIMNEKWRNGDLMRSPIGLSMRSNEDDT